MEPRLRACPEQFAVLVEFMERHGDLSSFQAGPQGRLRSEQMWRELTSLLNCVGGGVQRSYDKWKKVWADWKSKTKKKFLQMRQHASGTGGGPNSRLALTRIEERVIAVMGLSAVEGLPGVQERGLNRPSSSSQEADNGIIIEVHPDNRVSRVSPVPPPPVDSLPPSPSPPPPPTPPPAPASTSPTFPAPPSTRPNRTPPRLLLSNRSSPRRRRRRGQTPMDRATSEFTAVELARLRFEERRETLHHQREVERLRLESRRIDADEEYTRVLNIIADVAKKFVDK